MPRRLAKSRLRKQQKAKTKINLDLLAENQKLREQVKQLEGDLYEASYKIRQLDSRLSVSES